MITPFSRTASAPPQAWWAKFIRRPDPAGAQAAIERLLASHDTATIPPNAVAEILSAHRVSGDTARAIVYLMWSRAFQACAADLDITDGEIEYLRRLQHALGLSDSDVDALRIKTSSDFYRAAMSEALADAVISPSEQGALDAIARALELTDAEKADISRESLTVVMQRVFGEVIADRRISPVEQAKLDRLAKQLGVDLHNADDIGPQLDKFRFLWRIENEALPVISVPINLQRGEVCHCTFPARWHELRTRTVRRQFAGPVASIRIVKGLHYRIGSYQVNRVTTTELQEIDAGTTYITNKRLIFDGALKNTNIRHSAVLSLQAYSDGVGIEKASGRSPILITSGDAEVITAIYAEALNRSS